MKHELVVSTCLRRRYFAECACGQVFFGISAVEAAYALELHARERGEKTP